MWAIAGICDLRAIAGSASASSWLGHATRTMSQPDAVSSAICCSVAFTLAVIGGTSAVGSLVTGWLGARYPKHILLGLIYILRAIIFVAYFALPPTPTTTLLFAAGMGLLWWPGLAPLIGGLVAEIFGTRYLATLLGVSFVVHQVGSSLGAWGGGLIFDLSGSYEPAWQIGTLIGFTAGVVQILAGGPTKRQDLGLYPRSQRSKLTKSRATKCWKILLASSLNIWRSRRVGSAPLSAVGPKQT